MAEGLRTESRNTAAPCFGAVASILTGRVGPPAGRRAPIESGARCRMGPRPTNARFSFFEGACPAASGRGLAWLLPPRSSCSSRRPRSAGAPRLALVVGNAAYPARPLATAVNDAALVAQALAQAGFDVTAARDLDAPRLRAALAAFVDAARAAGPDATLFVYFTGYGVAIRRRQFLSCRSTRVSSTTTTCQPRRRASTISSARSPRCRPRRASSSSTPAGRIPLRHRRRDAAGAGPRPECGAGRDDRRLRRRARHALARRRPALWRLCARARRGRSPRPASRPNALFDRVRLRVGMLTNGGQVPWGRRRRRRWDPGRRARR